jgi:hypothetical protein
VSFENVTPGLVPGIHESTSGFQEKGVDGRIKPGHDD